MSDLEKAKLTSILEIDLTDCKHFGKMEWTMVPEGHPLDLMECTNIQKIAILFNGSQLLAKQSMYPKIFNVSNGFKGW